MSMEDSLYRVLFQSAPDPLLLLEDGQILDVNAGALALLEVAREEIVGQSLLSLSAPAQPDGCDSAAALEAHLAALEDGELLSFEWTYQLPNETSLTLTTALQQLTLGDRTPVVATLSDAKGRPQQPGAAGKQDSERAQNVLDNVQDGYYEVDLSGNHTFVNRALCDMFGYVEDELLAMNYRQYMDEETAARIFEVFNQVYRTGEPVSSIEYEVIGHSGERRAIQASVSLLRDAKNQPAGFRGFVRDISAQKQAEERLRAARDELEQRVERRTAELARINSKLEQRIAEGKQAAEEIKKQHQSQEVLNRVLQLSVEDLSLEQMLGRAFDLIVSVPWLKTLPQGSIFLVGNQPEVLELTVQRGLAAPLLNMCARVPFGHCLCGMAADSGKTIFADCLDQRHENDYEGIQEHGHYNVPIILDETVIGVINLYLAAGHQQDEHETNFLESVANVLAGLIERKRTEERYQRLLELRHRQVRLSTSIAQEITAATDLKDLYRRVVTQVKEQFGYYHTQLLRYDPALDTVALVVGYGEVGEKMLAMHHSIPMGVGLIGVAASTGKSLLRPDVFQEANWQSNPLLPDTRGELTVPIKMGPQVLGVLDVQSDEVNALNEEDQLLLEGLCGQIAVAIESTRLRQDMESRLRELNALQRQMSREGWENYQFKKTHAPGYQFDHTGVQPIEPDAFVPAIEREPVDSSKNGHSSKLSRISGPSAVTTPLLARGETFGMLGVVDNPAKPLTPEERDLLAAVSDQVAEALEVARLFEQTEDSLAEQGRLTAELETVAQVSVAASTLLDVDTLLQSVVDLTKNSFDLYHAHVYLLDKEKQKLILRAGAGNVGRLMVLEGREISTHAASLVARAARDRQSFYENDVRRTVDFLPHPLLPETQAELVVPMIVGDTLVGVLDVQSDKVGFFSAKDMQIHKTLAAQIAVAVQNALLFEEQVEAAAKLRQVDQLKSEFLASMSHELRTPLNSIIGFADVLLEGLDGELNERMEEDVRLIHDSGAHLRSLIGDILDMTKIEAGRMELRYENIDMRQFANDIMATAHSLAQEKALEMYLHMDDAVDFVEADRTRLRQILWNIVGNAIKFTEKGHVTLSMQMRDDDLVIAVRDTGIGIKPDQLPAVFEQFRQVDGSLNRSAGGTGLGMPITKNLVELHGGKIWVESVHEQGSTFWFTIPRTRPPLRRITSPLVKA